MLIAIVENNYQPDGSVIAVSYTHLDVYKRQDLGYVGKEIVIDILKSKGYNIKSNYNDCGVLIFDKNSQDTHSGGSGCCLLYTSRCV